MSVGNTYQGAGASAFAGRGCGERVGTFVVKSVEGVKEVGENLGGGKAAGEVVFGMTVGAVDTVVEWFDWVAKYLGLWILLSVTWAVVSIVPEILVGRSVCEDAWWCLVLWVPGVALYLFDTMCPVVVEVGFPFFLGMVAVGSGLRRRVDYTGEVRWPAFVPGLLLLAVAEFSAFPLYLYGGKSMTVWSGWIASVAAAVLGPVVYRRGIVHGRSVASVWVLFVACVGLFGFSGFIYTALAGTFIEYFSRLLKFGLRIYGRWREYGGWEYIVSVVGLVKGAGVDDGGGTGVLAEDTARKLTWAEQVEAQEEWFEVESGRDLVSSNEETVVGEGSLSSVVGVATDGDSYATLEMEAARRGEEKLVCGVCGFKVKVVGHRDRCRKPCVAGEVSLRVDAWMGDVLHALDVRSYLVEQRVSEKELEVRAQQYLGAAAQADFYRDYEGEKKVAMGSSDRCLSQAFEASYRGVFRDRYVVEKFGVFVPPSRVLYP